MAIVTTKQDSVRSINHDWRYYVKTAIRDFGQLCRHLGLDVSAFAAWRKAEQQFATFVPLPFLQRIEPNNPRDPLLLQVIPSRKENFDYPSFVADPVGDMAATLAPGVIHKYQGRALLIATGQCAINCRYCFRRHFPYETRPNSTDQWARSIRGIQNDRAIEEIILSGGDPLMLVDSKIHELIKLIESIPQVQRLRIHSRLPIVIPQRVTDKLVETLNQTRLKPVIVIHSNHPNELDRQVGAAITKLFHNGMLVLNQSVLLKGVNDDARTLIELSRKLIDVNCMPYYLHQLDQTAGTAHFEVPIQTGIKIIEKMRSSLPGYAVPRYVQEIAGEESKRILA